MKRPMSDYWLSVPEDVELRKIRKIDWLPFEETTILHDEFVIRPARNTPEDLQGVAETFRTGFPILQGGEYEVMYDPAAYPMIFGEGEDFNTQENFLIVTEHLRSQTICAGLMLTMHKCERTVEFVIVSIDEKYQSQGIGRHLFECTENYVERCGTEMAYIWMTAKHTITQEFALSKGFVPRGVIPGMYQAWAGNGKAYRVAMIYFQKFYGGAEHMCSTSLKLVPEAEELIVPWRDNGN